jgi:hypothetical protein
LLMIVVIKIKSFQLASHSPCLAVHFWN